MSQSRRFRRQQAGLAKSVPASTKISKHTEGSTAGSFAGFRTNRFQSKQTWLDRTTGKILILSTLFSLNLYRDIIWIRPIMMFLRLMVMGD